MTFLIDGYNLMHAVGLAHPTMAQARFERARERFLDWLADAVAGRADVLRVVFDAHSALAASDEADRRGVKVRFAFRRTADDLIEELVAAEPRPEALAVVSNDSRVREAGRHRGCGALTCEEFTDWLITGSPVAPPVPPPEPEKPEPDPAEVKDLLRAFSTPKPRT